MIRIKDLSRSIQKDDKKINENKSNSNGENHNNDPYCNRDTLHDEITFGVGIGETMFGEESSPSQYSQQKPIQVREKLSDTQAGNVLNPHHKYQHEGE